MTSSYHRQVPRQERIDRGWYPKNREDREYLDNRAYEMSCWKNRVSTAKVIAAKLVRQPGMDKVEQADALYTMMCKLEPEQDELMAIVQALRHELNETKKTLESREVELKIAKARVVYSYDHIDQVSKRLDRNERELRRMTHEYTSLKKTPTANRQPSPPPSSRRSSPPPHRRRQFAPPSSSRYPTPPRHFARRPPSPVRHTTRPPVAAYHRAPSRPLTVTPVSSPVRRSPPQYQYTEKDKSSSSDDANHHSTAAKRYVDADESDGKRVCSSSSSSSPGRYRDSDDAFSEHDDVVEYENDNSVTISSSVVPTTADDSFAEAIQETVEEWC